MSRSRIAKGFSLCTAFVGLLCLLTGVGIAVCAWVLNSQLPDDFSYDVERVASMLGDDTTETGHISVGGYWWAGLIVSIPTKSGF